MTAEGPPPPIFHEEIDEPPAEVAGAGPSPPRPWVDERQPLPILLRGVFGHPEFRPYQEEVCRAVMEGQDVLLVMPTGAGKSLCYQLPALALGGSALVITPLIALMEDQVADLKRHGIVAERLHSGREAAEAAQTVRAWRAGEIDLLFVAPERLAVDSFQGLLRDRPPRLIAVDEAHCISHWGHDFRPDYRLVGERLIRSEGTPLIALTATATPRVQDDIVRQLGVPRARRFIRGFRRRNLAIECVEAPPSARHPMVAEVVADPSRRPALIYAPSRKETEGLAEELSRIAPAAAYHAGLPSRVRDRVQAEFLDGDLEIVVATIAFGMGVDKPDIRTVFHTALPGSLEAYYQEIGRAGRDGEPSRAILLWSWADRRTHEFFHGRDYPEPGILERVFECLSDRALSKDDLQRRLGLKDEVVVAALNQLWIHRGARVDPEVNALRGSENWRTTYAEQREHRLAMLDAICGYAGSTGCRMTAIVRHFGDREDAGEGCGLCDHCASSEALLRKMRSPDQGECEVLEAIVGALSDTPNRTTGQLFKATAEPLGMERKAFERLIDALAREEILEVWSDTFTKDGHEIRFRRAALPPGARRAGAFDPSAIELPQEIASKAGGAKKRRTGAAKKRIPTTTVLSSTEEELLKALKHWRLGEARRRRTPAFRIFGDRTLEALARARPFDLDELLEIPGIGPAKARKYGEKLLRIIAGER